MIKDLDKKEITKRELLEKIKDKIKREKELRLRKTLSQKSFEMPDWSKYLAYQLGFIAALEELDNFLPDPETLK